MLRVDFVSLFPDMVLHAARQSMLRRAEESSLVSFHATNPRDFAEGRHRTVDDTPYGGGPGMLMMAEPLLKAIRSLPTSEDTEVILTDPTGEPFTQHAAEDLASKKHIVFICGHYEGVDDRIRQAIATRTYSLGDFVLTGGELPSLTIADAVVRLLPGVLGCARSLDIDSHADGLLSAPQFTKPESVLGLSVPDVLRSGDHGALDLWKRRESLIATRERRPDLFCRARLRKSDLDLLQS